MSRFDPHADLAAVAAGTERLLATVDRLSDEDLAAPSLCPGWTRGHVVAHLTHNADALLNLLTWAATGEPTPQYASREARNAAIEADAGKPAVQHRADLRAAAQRFQGAAERLPAQAWEAGVRWGAAAAGSEQPAARVPWSRLKEVEIHHVDLAADYTPAHWDAAFVTRVLDEAVRMFDRDPAAPAVVLETSGTGVRRGIRAETVPDAPVVRGPEPALLAWALGRSDGEGLTVEPDGPLPRLPAWA